MQIIGCGGCGRAFGNFVGREFLRFATSQLGMTSLASFSGIRDLTDGRICDQY